MNGCFNSVDISVMIEFILVHNAFIFFFVSATDANQLMVLYVFLLPNFTSHIRA